MITQRDILETIELQSKVINRTESYDRELLSTIQLNLQEYAYIITGVRRCGKSTLITQLLKRVSDKSLFLNFDTARLYDFKMDNFKMLDHIIGERQCEFLFFDEIQLVDGWEVYVRGKLDEGYHVIITGSNASLLSRELGTHLTGRHISKTLYPFSYREFLGYKGLSMSAESLMEYINIGGFPNYIKTKDDNILDNLVQDILYRDIIVRYGVREERAIKSLMIFLLSNIGSLVSTSKLKSIIGVKSAQTVLDYLTFLENVYIISCVRKFSYSYRSQTISPQKVYCIDLGIHNCLSSSFSANSGHKLENVVYLGLLRHSYEVFYYNEEQSECDFIALKNGSVESIIQVCEDLNLDNQEREVKGLISALDFFQKDKGYILTMDQDDLIYYEGKTIVVLPVWKFLCE